MTAILFIGIVIASAVAVLVKAGRGGAKKAQKWEKADIMKQLLALSENEGGPSPAVPARPRKVPAAQAAKAAKFHQKPSGKISQRAHVNK